MSDDLPVLHGDAPIFKSAELEWVILDKGQRLRLAKWQGGARGVVHIFSGRTEYIEKFADLIARLVERGFSVTCHDWRGQGLSTRNEKFPVRCHIKDFADFQKDTDAIMEACKDMPEPRRLFCHSMGGAIGLEFLNGKSKYAKKIESVVFSAPMWGIYVPLLLRPFVNIIARYAKASEERLWRTVPGTDDRVYEVATPFWRNLLTCDKATYMQLRRNIEICPALGLAGPTYYWYFAAIAQIEALRRAPRLDIPGLVFVGSREKIVDPQTIRSIGKALEKLEFVELKGAKHELYAERQQIRDQLWQHIDRLWLAD